MADATLVLSLVLITMMTLNLALARWSLARRARQERSDAALRPMSIDVGAVLALGLLMIVTSSITLLSQSMIQPAAPALGRFVFHASVLVTLELARSLFRRLQMMPTWASTVLRWFQVVVIVIGLLSIGAALLSPVAR